MTKPSIRVLLVEDTDADAQIVHEVLSEDPDATFAITRADRLAKGLELLKSQPPHVVLMDMHLPDAKGLEVLLNIRKQAPWVPVVVLTASFDERAVAIQLLQHGAQDYLEKGTIQIYRKMLGRSIRYAIERARVEGELRQAHAENARVLASLPSILIGLTPDGRVIQWNAVAESTFGVRAADAIGKPLAECPIRWDAQRVLSHLEHLRTINGSSRLDDVQFIRADGQERLLGINVVLMAPHDPSDLGALLFGADITDRKQAEADRLRLQEELAQAQKMETFGRFAGGIAHDFNNFLQVILGFTWLIRARARDDHELMSDMQEIIHAAESASAMVRQLLAFGRRQPLQPKVFDINPAVTQMQRLLQQFVGEAIRVVITVADTPLTVQLDPTGLEQVIMNLCSNARDSMPEGGALTIRTAYVALDEAFVRQHAWAKPGAFVCLSVTDTGIGMEPSIASHIFEPFFTTKKPGKGTGLGLAVVYGVVKQHDGFVDVETAPGQGTTFKLYFPHQDAPAPSGDAKRGGRGTGTETVLLLETPDRQQALDEEVLRESGYEVVSGAATLDRLSELSAQLRRAQLIVLEPGADAGLIRAWVQALRQAAPHARLLLVTGAPEQALRAAGVSGPGLRILARPYTPDRLLDMAQELLGEPAPRADNGAKRHLLIVDDEASIRTLCERILREHYDVTVVASGREALTQLAKRPFDLLITDMKMPEMDGLELLQEITKVKPAQRAIVMSGYLTDDKEQALSQLGSSCRILRKPFEGSVLQQAVKEHLDA